MLSKSEIDALLKQKREEHTRLATAKERQQLKGYLRQHGDKEMALQLDTFTVHVCEESAEVVVFTWQRAQSASTLCDAYFARLPKN